MAPSTKTVFTQTKRLDSGIDPNVDQPRTAIIQALAQQNEVTMHSPSAEEIVAWEQKLPSIQDNKAWPLPSRAFYHFGNTIGTRGLCNMSIVGNTGVYSPYGTGTEMVAQFSVPFLLGGIDIRIHAFADFADYAFTQGMTVRQSIETNGVYFTEVVISQQHYLWGQYQHLARTEYYDDATQSLRVGMLCTPLGATPDKKDCLGNPKFANLNQFTVVETSANEISHYTIKMIAARVLTNDQRHTVVKDGKSCEIENARVLANQFKITGTFAVSDAPHQPTAFKTAALMQNTPSVADNKNIFFIAPGPADTKANPKWTWVEPKYCVYVNRHDKSRIGVATCNLSESYYHLDGSRYVSRRAGFELLFELPRALAPIAANANDQIILNSIGTSPLYKIIKHVAHESHMVSSEIQQALQNPKLKGVCSVELLVDDAELPLPSEFRDSNTGRFCILIGDLVKANANTPTLQSEAPRYLTVRLLTAKQQAGIRLNGNEARLAIAENWETDNANGIPDEDAKCWNEFFKAKGLYPLSPSAPLPSAPPSALPLVTQPSAPTATTVSPDASAVLQASTRGIGSSSSALFKANNGSSSAASAASLVADKDRQKSFSRSSS